MSNCRNIIDNGTHDPFEYIPINCPNCGKFVKWDSIKEEFSCICNNITTIKRSEGWFTIKKKV